MLDLVIVTGASRGIGASIAADAGAYARHVVAIGSSAAIRSAPVPGAAQVHRLQLDLGDPAATERAVKTEVARLGPIRHIGLALCAAQIGRHGGLASAEFAAWSRIFAINVLGNLAVTKACLPLAEAGASLRAVFFGGGGAAYGYPEFSAYALSKVAIVRAVENLALETQANGLDVAAVALAPGAVDTDMLATVLAHGGAVKTKTDIAEPTAFVRRFLNDEIASRALNGRFVHVRDNLLQDFAAAPDTLFKLRRVE
jgi:3-oxoacyl-[acyl-carrier protein] reductase